MKIKISLITLVALTLTYLFPLTSVSAQTNSGPNIYHWSQGQAEVQMMSTTDGFCFLVGVSGDLEGDGESVWIYNTGDPGYWMLGGKSGKKGVAAFGHCVPYSAFHGVTVTGWYISYRDGDKKHWPFEQLDWDASLCYLTGLSGKFNGAGESVTVNEDGNGQFFASATTNQPFIRVAYGCLKMVDSETGKPARQLTQVPGMYLRTYGQSSSGSQRYYLGVDPNVAICVLNSVAGRFKGGGELILLDAQLSDHSVLINSQKIDVEAKVTCYYYNQ